MAERRDIATRFQPGWKGGPGRPKGSTDLNTLLRKALSGYSLGGVETEDGRTVAEHFIEHLIGHAMKGNASLAKEILERISGKVPDAEPDRNSEAADIVAEAKQRRDDAIDKQSE